MKKKISLMIAVILILQILLPMLTVIWESGFTIKSVAAEKLEATVDGITWTYTLDEQNNAIDVEPKNRSTLPTEVVIPSTLNGHTVKKLCWGAFNRCNSLTSVTIPETVTSIEEYTFENSDSLTSINVSENNSFYSSENGVLFDKNKTGIIKYPSGKVDEEYTIPNTVTYIKAYAFSRCSNLINVTIPEGVTSIGRSAFGSCNSLTSINIPSSVTKLYGIGTIEGYYMDVFEGCSSLTSINVSENNPDYASENGVLFDKNKTELMIYPAKKADTDYTIPNSVTSIAEEAFYGCGNLINLTIPEGVARLKRNTFIGCSNLRNVEIKEKLIGIGNDTFYECSNLTNINIPEGITDIGDRAFYGCSSLTGIINIREGVTNIKGSAFEGCSSLTSINIPEGVTRIESYAFKGCSSLTSINIPEEVTSIGSYAFKGCSSLTSINIPEGVTSIEWSVFEDCSSLKSINISEGVTRIGYDAFSNCSSLERVNIPESVTSVEWEAFKDCSSLTKIVIPNSVTDINWSSFSGCNKLTIYCRSNSYAKSYAEERNIKYVIDDTTPTITSVVATPSGWTKKDVKITVKATDSIVGLAAEAYSFDGGKTWQKENTKTYNNHENIVIKVKDNLGNIATKNIEVKIDKEAPLITSIEGNPEDWTKENVTLTINANDTLSGLAEQAYSFDGGTTWQTESTKTYTENMGFFTFFAFTGFFAGKAGS